ncbi:myosin-binding protein 2-like isoform X2 [Phragmites australis]|uniref:myosin-binding protein 2-like isoform X2 n=1 Tax=Phragmites australis TaxID=29695 RepID=UPI002D779BCF|nr:myosin-binding protein 2-like isoform X2 [Phragmites australis]
MAFRRLPRNRAAEMVAEAPMAGARANLTAALCKRSNRVSRVLAYALLEWILIALLLANGVFSYLISRFAAFFGLAPPCALCSRLGVDSLFEPHLHRRQGIGGGAEPLRRVLCNAHSAEVSRLGYCCAHRRLADAGNMCEDCAAAAAAAPGKALLSWMGRSELGERDLACACCGVALESGFYSPPFLLPRPSPPRGSDCGRKEEVTASLNGDVVFVSEDGPVIELFDEKPLVEDDSIGVMAQCAEIVGSVERLVPLESIDSLAIGMAAVSSQSGGERKELVDHGVVVWNDVVPENTGNANEEKFVMTSDDDKVDGVLDRLIEEQIAAVVLAPTCMEGIFDDGINASETVEGFADQQFPEEVSGLKDNDLKISIGDEISEDEQVEQAALEQELYTMPEDHKDHEFVEKLDRSTEVENFQQAELRNKLGSMPMEVVVHVATTSYENTEEKQVQQAELNPELDSVSLCTREHADDELERKRTAQAGVEQECDFVPTYSGEHVCVTPYAHTDDEQAEVKQKSTSVTADALEYVSDTFDDNTITGKDTEEDPTEASLPSLHQICCEPLTNLDKLSPDHSVVEEERAPDTPTHSQGICDSQELLYSKAVTSDTKSVDSSIATTPTDLESTELASVNQLKSALAAARKSLNTLYAELENERNAAAISADETMAMINRLQEQKAAMQMEAIQYQRLMEEQSEYDQEVLQRLNELVVKREKEKQDLERELELYRHKVHLYEAKVRKMSRHKVDDQNGSSSASSSAEYSDDLSQSFYEGDESAHGLNGSNGSIPTDIVLQETARHLVTLDDSLADFEAERLSILEQLKLLEDRLFDLDDEEPDNTKMDKHFSEENHLMGVSNGFSDDDISFKLHDKRKGVSCRGKKLLPLFDDATVENGNIHLTKQDTEADHSTEVTLELAREQDKLAIANEIDQVHERLHALEADREFIKQCVRSLKKGGKGFDLLQEILQHLGDLRRIEQHARNSRELSPRYLHPYMD